MKNNLEDLVKHKPKVVIVCGPTATGKSKLSIELAKHFSGEIIGADSMQIYKDLVIGTAAVTPKEMDGIPHHMVGFLPPEKTFSVADYVQMATTHIQTIVEQQKLPILSGGTGLYLSALLQGTIFTPEKPNEVLREELWKQADELGTEAMLQKLMIVDPDYAKQLHISDAKRILRALEQYELTGKTRKQRDIESKGEPRYNFYCIGLTYNNRQTLYDKINSRVDEMVNNGLLQEAELVFNHKDEYKTAAQSIGYKEYFPYFMNEDSLENCTEKLKQATRRYAKRQLTWFRAIEQIHWLEIDDFPTSKTQAINQIQTFLTTK